MPGQFEGKVAIVTGGNSGIGKAAAIRFAQEGAKVVIAARRVEEGEQAAQEIRDSGGDVIFVKTDVSQAAEVEAMLNKTVETYGRLDCAFNNAAARPTSSPTHEFEEDDWDMTMNANLKGAWLCMKYEIIHMLKQGSGSIVNTSSGAGLVGTPNISAYVASKHGVIGLTKTAALEYAPKGIRVNAVCPGYTLTPMLEPSYNNPERRSFLIAKQPIGRVGTSDEVAAAALWLCSDDASFVTGIAMPVDGGYIAQ